MPAHVVARVEELPPGSRRILEVAGRSIGVFNVAGSYFALRNRCPHQGGPLCEGRTSGFLVGERPGEYRYSRPGEVLRCPWHGWEFDLRSGQSWFDPARTRVRAYPVTVAPGAELGSAQDPTAPGSPRSRARETSWGGAPGGAPGLQPGPYQAETYPVSVEGRYVVVDLPD